MKLRIPQWEIISQWVYKVANLEESFWFDGNNFLVPSSEMGQLIQKTILLHKMSHIQLNQAFLVFWSIYAEIDKKIVSKH